MDGKEVEAPKNNIVSEMVYGFFPSVLVYAVSVALVAVLIGPHL